LLGRDEFAQRLANDIRAWTGDDSLVIAIYGDWGSGKTSLKERVSVALAHSESELSSSGF
jgi:predicted KAP-like P-loop ATPase